MPDAASGLTLAAPFGTLAELVAQHARARPDATALVAGGERLAYGALDAAMDRVAARLQRDGAGPGHAVAICADASVNHAVAFLGALRAGCAVAPLAPSSTPDSLAAMVADCGARHAFLDAGARATLAKAAGADVSGAIMIDAASAFEAGSLEKWLGPEGAPPRRVEVTPDMPFNIIYSSGTTGAPKGIVQSHAMRWSHVTRAALFGYGGNSVTLCSTPLYSNTTLVSFFPALASGGAVALLPKFDARAFLEMSQALGVTHAMLVPAQYRRIMDVPDFGAFDLSRYVTKFSTSAPFSAALKRDIVARWPGALIEYYGMTEGGGTCILAAHLHPGKLHTVGQPAEGHDIRLIDEAGGEVARGGTGEVVGASGAMMDGYLNQPGKTGEAEWFDASGKRFIRTGDVGRFDEDGFLVLMDRRKDMVISGGFNIYPSDLEAVLAGHEGVREAAVVGAPSRKWGETPVAFVVPREGAGLDAEALRLWANERLGKMQRIARVELIGALPRSPIGKVLKRELRDGIKGELE